LPSLSESFGGHLSKLCSQENVKRGKLVTAVLYIICVEYGELNTIAATNPIHRLASANSFEINQDFTHIKTWSAQTPCLAKVEN
jgi:dihydroxyacid dehydratase/phosphogluconate dehydratase